MAPLVMIDLGDVASTPLKREDVSTNPGVIPGVNKAKRAIYRVSLLVISTRDNCALLTSLYPWVRPVASVLTYEHET